MTEKELIEKLSQLKNEEPDQNWVLFCRQGLASKIRGLAESQPAVQKLNIAQIWSFLGHITFNKAFRPVAAFLAIFGLVLSSGLFTLAKAKDSLPGDRLYSVKIALEQAKILTTTSPEKKADLQSQIMALRLEELTKVVEKQEPMNVKQPKVEEAVGNLQRQMMLVKDELPKLDNANTGAKKKVEVAKRIDNNASQAEQTLSQVRAIMPSSETNNLAERIAEASDTASKTGTKALEMMVGEQGEAESGISQEEIIANLGQKIQKTGEKIKTLGQAVSSNSATSSQFYINAAIILDQSDEALIQARASLDKNDVAGALETLKAANEMVSSAEKLVGSAVPSEESSDADGSTKPIDSNASSTSGILPQDSVADSGQSSTTFIIIYSSNLNLE
ncbi:MAG: hypothetical protein HY764_02465 [Candidatus Portnoybacteria bacterium]|nr:hypothetical protein [Candidatus Portnoybacteria bacterium]